MTTTVKTCFKCNVEKPVEDFYRHSRMKDGHLNKCKQCTKADVIKNRNENIEYYREYDIARSKLPHRKLEMLTRCIAERKRNPDKYSARSAVTNAVRDGRLEKTPCVICGASKVVGHHEDYSRPLDVVWMCQAHHVQYHKGKIKLPGKIA